MAEPTDIGSALLQMFAHVVDAATPLLPEIAVSDVLGVGWAEVEGSRQEGLDYFCRAAAEQLRPHGGKARGLLEVLAQQAPPGAAAAIREQADSTPASLPAWVPMLGSVEPLDVTLSADRAGREENFLLHFGYRSGDAIVGRHVIIARVDHSSGLLEDAFLADPDVDFATIRRTFADNRELIVRDLTDPGYAARRILPAMRATDDLPSVHLLGEELRQCWSLLTSRIPVLTSATTSAAAPTSTERSRLVTRFLALKEVKQTVVDERLARPTQRRLARAIIDYQYDMAGGSWTPLAVEAFFMEWAVEQDWEGAEVALPELMLDYMFWTLKGTNYAPVTMAVSRWGHEFIRA